jgi:hypothetical protein
VKYPFWIRISPGSLPKNGTLNLETAVKKNVRTRIKDPNRISILVIF